MKNLVNVTARRVCRMRPWWGAYIFFYYEVLTCWWE